MPPPGDDTLPAATPRWATRLLALGRRRTTMLLTGASVAVSVALVAVFAVVFAAEPEDLPQYFIPAFVVPSIVAPLTIRFLLDLVEALDTAHRQAARQQQELERVQRLDLVGRLASGMAHDLNNLLTVVRASVEALGGAAANQDLAAVDDAAQRGARLTRRLLAISRHDEVVRTPQTLGPIIVDVRAAVRRILPEAVHLVMPATVPPVVLELDADAVQQALLNLVLNARDALGARGRITLAVREVVAPSNSWCVVSVTDDGPGMSTELLARATEPFVTTKATHQGTGLGLAIVQRTMEQHGGRLELSSAEGQGTTATLWFPVPSVPIAGAESASPVVGTAPALDPSAARRLLLVDDEAEVRVVTARSLQRLGYDVATAADAMEARAWLAEHTPVDAIVSDIMMPGATGLELLHELRAAGNTTPVLLVSGFSLERLDETLATVPAVRFLAKPWTQQSLGDALTTLLAAPDRSSAER